MEPLRLHVFDSKPWMLSKCGSKCVEGPEGSFKVNVPCCDRTSFDVRIDGEKIFLKDLDLAAKIFCAACNLSPVLLK